jgi:two-component system, LytTR family, response regulator
MVEAPNEQQALTLNYPLFKKISSVIGFTALSVVIYNGFFYLHPSNQAWIRSNDFSFVNLFQFILIDQFLFECITTFILFRLIILYARFFKPGSLRYSTQSILKYLVSFLPLFSISYFIFSPVTLSGRFLYHIAIGRAVRGEYFQDYFFLNTRIYIAYLFPVFLTGYVSLIVNLLSERMLSIKHVKRGERKPDSKPDVLFVKDPVGKLPIKVSSIIWIERQERKYIIKTITGSYFLNNTTAEKLEEELSPYEFVRINRSALVPIANIKNYTFWENDKYILRTKDDKEFIISRQRLRKLIEKFRILDLNSRI